MGGKGSIVVLCSNKVFWQGLIKRNNPVEEVRHCEHLSFFTGLTPQLFWGPSFRLFVQEVEELQYHETNTQGCCHVFLATLVLPYTRGNGCTLIHMYL
jgi:hypothetical protein